ncbi:MAG: BNR/Asp-box repeat-containing protein [Bacteroidetes bacterium]|nr:MAG: BNR/Asp-box repeat-containing protein [Bacteroidota bacterium]
MKNKLFFVFALMFAFTISRAQQTAMQFSGVDCNSNAVDLFADLNAGKAVVLFYYMPNCGACPPPAQKIQTMANNIMNTYPGMVKGYAYPYQNSTTCAYSASWVTNNNLTMYAPMDSGAAQVAYYGGFGMPTVVLVGGADHRVLFSTLSFSTSDTTIMRDSILGLLNPSGINGLNSVVSSVNVFPSPATDKVQVELNLKQSADLKIEIVNMLGELVSSVYNQNTQAGLLKKEIPTAALSNGVYFIRLSAGDKVQNHKFTVAH